MELISHMRVIFLFQVHFEKGLFLLLHMQVLEGSEVLHRSNFVFMVPCIANLH